MITEQDLQEAIAECEGTRNPNANTCLKLAAFYTIRNEMFGTKEPRIPTQSFESAPEPPYESETEFSEKIKGVDVKAILGLFDEVMTALQVLNPRLYNATMDKLFDIRRGG